MTDHLHRTFGLQFVFFTSKGHDRPFGYVIIDHVRRQVYKGSDVLRMAQVMGEGMGGSGRNKGEREVGRGDGWPEGGEREGNQETRKGGELIAAMDQIMADGERNLAEDARVAEGVAKRKKRRSKGPERG